MTGPLPPSPVRLRARQARHAKIEIDLGALEQDLHARVDGEVRFDKGTRGAYSTDASSFRQLPIGVVIPRSSDAAAQAVGVCFEHGAPVLSRGGMSLAGQCTNTAIIIDWTKYCNRLISVDLEARTCVVEPGIVLDVLNAALAPHGLRYGPEPATHPNCTIGGMIGNNSCGATAQRSGKVVDNIARLEVLCYDGTRFWCGETNDEELAQIAAGEDPRARIYRCLSSLRDRYAEEIRARYPEIRGRVSGYNLDSLLPEHHFDVAGLLVGSESTLVTVLHAELELIPVLEERTLVVLGFENIMKAADAVPAVLAHRPIALEGIDHRLIRDQRIKHINPIALDDLPKGNGFLGNGFLMVQFGGQTRSEVDEAAEAMLRALGESEHDPDVAFLDEPEREDELWRVREAGLGATAHVPGHPDTWEGWEDSAVAPERLGAYLRDLEALYEEFGYADDAQPALYGHFGQGCVHTRIPFAMTDVEGVATYRRFLEQAASLVASYGGSLSGEHGDGQTRGELLPIMFGGTIMSAFAELKAIFDPQNRMNPGKVVAPARLDEHLRLGGSWGPHHEGDAIFSYPQDGGSFIAATNRSGGLVVGLEPSCLSVFRADGPELLGDDLDAERLHKASVTLAELLTRHTPGWSPPRMDGIQGSAQVHCHQHAVLGWEADRALLEEAGARIERLESGCCGLAGNFGFEPGHFEISKACADDVLLPAVRAMAQDEVLLADGFSCRAQIHELDSGGHEALRLARLLARQHPAETRPRPHAGPVTSLAEER